MVIDTSHKLNVHVLYLKLKRFDVTKSTNVIYNIYILILLNKFLHSILQQAFTSSSSSFKISIESFNKKLTVNQQREFIDVSIKLANYPHITNKLNLICLYLVLSSLVVSLLFCFLFCFFVLIFLHI